MAQIYFNRLIRKGKGCAKIWILQRATEKIQRFFGLDGADDEVVVNDTQNTYQAPEEPKASAPRQPLRSQMSEPVKSKRRILIRHLSRTVVSRRMKRDLKCKMNAFNQNKITC